MTVSRTIKGRSPNPEAHEHLEAGERGRPLRSHMPSHPVLASVSHRNKRGEGLDLTVIAIRGYGKCCLLATLLGIPSSQRREMEFLVPAQVSALQQWGHCSARAKGSFCTGADGAKFRALVWGGARGCESPL